MARSTFSVSLQLECVKLLSIRMLRFQGLLVGPRGNSLKKMERESGAKISIRGKGSVKEGKARSDQLTDDAEEDLHCLVIADTDEKVAACVKLINRVIETVIMASIGISPSHRSVQAASTPEGQNDHKRNQLRELAVLNGTLRDDENQTCQSCGSMGHRKYDCTEQRNFNTNIICRLCGGAGHVARDCSYGRGSDTVSSLLSGLSPRTNGYDFGCPMSELGNRPRSGAGDTSKAIRDGGQGSGRTLIAAGPKTFPWQELQFLQAANASLAGVDDRLPSQTGHDSFHSYSHGRQQWEARPSCPTQGLGA
jgi:splicing factor 1